MKCLTSKGGEGEGVHEKPAGIACGLFSFLVESELDQSVTSVLLSSVADVEVACQSL